MSAAEIKAQLRKALKMQLLQQAKQGIEQSTKVVEDTRQAEEEAFKSNRRMESWKELQDAEALQKQRLEREKKEQLEEEKRRKKEAEEKIKQEKREAEEMLKNEKLR